MDLPAGAKIHPVVHVSQLKKHVPATTTVSSDVSSVCADPTQQSIVAQRSVIRGNKVVLQYLIQWSGLPTTMATWEDASAISEKKE